MHANYEAILARLRDVTEGRGAKVRQSGGRWQCCCPAHDDRRPSLVVKVGHDGALVAACLSQGCSFAEIAAALGTDRRDWFPPKDDWRPVKMPERVIDKVYDYRDASGVLRYQNVR